MGKNGGLWGWAVVLVLTLVCAAACFGGFGRSVIRVQAWTDASDSAQPLPVRSAVGDSLVNVNTADLEALTALPGIGAVRAERIIAFREANGPFQSTADLLAVEGIGPGILERIRDLICLEDDYEDLDH